jgi:hypothetical protein
MQVSALQGVEDSIEARAQLVHRGKVEKHCWRSTLHLFMLWIQIRHLDPIPSEMGSY